MNPADRFQGVAVFQHLPANRLGQLARVWSEERYEKGAILFRQGAPAKSIWIIIEGWVHLVRSSSPDSDGSRAVVLFTVTPHEALCGISAIDADSYNMSAVAGIACRALRLPGEAFRDALTHEAVFAYDTLHLYARRIRKIAEQYGAMAEPVSHRVIRALLRLQEQFGDTIPMTHRELAQMAWTTTESAIRIVRHLKRQGYLKGSRGKVVVSNLKALKTALKPPPRYRV